MARKAGSTISQEELYPGADSLGQEELDDSRLLDLDAEEESPFLRGQKRVSVRRSSLPKRTATRLTWGAIAFGLLFMGGIAAAGLYHYGERSWRFRINSSDDIEITGLDHVTRDQVMDVMGGDIGRNIFFVPLSRRQQQLELIPWVASASVMRFVPNRLKIEIRERIPVAFARVGSKILLIDAGGTLMDLPTAGTRKYSFPVILGTNPGEPLSTRAARMKIYSDLINQLDSTGAHYSQDLSEVDLSDPEDVKVLTNDPQGGVLVHLGSANYLDRYKIYITHVQQWRQQFDKLESVDLRYDRQIIVNPDLAGTAKQPPISASAARAAMAAGVKPAALLVHESIPHTAHTAAATPPKAAAKPAVHTAPARAVHHKSATAKSKSASKAKHPAAHRHTAKANANARTGSLAAKGKPSPDISGGRKR
jgi:cell division protein FtsQ